jgi:hypothetical protein
MGGPEQRWDFFLAHAGVDAGPAEQLYQLLSAHSRVFLDRRCLRYGDDWDLELAKAQRTARVTVVLVSSRTESAYYAREEIAAAIGLARQQQEKHRVVPVYLDGAPPADAAIPYGLRLKHSITLSEPANLDFAARELLALLTTLQDGDLPESPTPIISPPFFDEERTLRRFRELPRDKYVSPRFVFGPGLPLVLLDRIERLFPHFVHERILAVYDNRFDNAPDDCWVLGVRSIGHFAKFRGGPDHSVFQISDLPDVTLDWTSQKFFRRGTIFVYDQLGELELEWMFLSGGAAFTKAIFDILRELQVTVAKTR